MMIPAFVPLSILRSPLKQWMEAKCADRGHTVEFHNVSEGCEGYRELFRSAQSVITWNCRMPHHWLHDRGQNVLHLDNALVSQRAGVFVDSKGFFSNSALATQRTWENPQPWNLEFYAQREFQWQAFAEGSPDGPVLVCLQCEADSSLAEYAAPKGEDKIERLLAAVKEYLPRQKIIVRPHPRERAKFAARQPLPFYCWSDDWEVQADGSFKDAVKGCSAVVTINSTCSYEALLAGVPVATLGKGCFSGAGVTLECASHEDFLASLPTWEPDRERVKAFLSTAMTRHFLPYDAKAGRKNQEFNIWLKNVQ